MHERVKVNKSRQKQGGVTHTFEPIKIIFRKDNDTILTQSIERSFLIYLLTTNDAIYRDSLILV